MAKNRKAKADTDTDTEEAKPEPKRPLPNLMTPYQLTANFESLRHRIANIEARLGIDHTGEVVDPRGMVERLNILAAGLEDTPPAEPVESEKSDG